MTHIAKHNIDWARRIIATDRHGEGRSRSDEQGKRRHIALAAQLFIDGDDLQQLSANYKAAPDRPSP